MTQYLTLIEIGVRVVFLSNSKATVERISKETLAAKSYSNIIIFWSTQRNLSLMKYKTKCGFEKLIGVLNP